MPVVGDETPLARRTNVLKRRCFLVPLALALLSGCAVIPEHPQMPTVAAPTVIPDLPETPTVTPDSAFLALQMAMVEYDPFADADGVIEALAQGCAQWLSEGHDPAELPDVLRQMLSPASEAFGVVEPLVTVRDLNGDGVSDVVIEPRCFVGLSVLGCLAEKEGGFTCQPLPASSAFGLETETRLTMNSGVLSQDLIGDGRPETIVTYTVQGGSGWTELLYVFRWSQAMSTDLVFHTVLENWAGRSRWQLAPDPLSSGRRQIVLLTPHVYDYGFDAKLVNHPLSRMIWRWDPDAAQFILVDKEVDLTQSGWGPEAEITSGDRLRWLTNEGEAAFRAGRYAQALIAYDKALSFAAAVAWTPMEKEPDWVGVLRFRRAQILAYLGRATEALSCMRAVARDYEGDLLGALAGAFLSSYGDGTGETAALEAYRALHVLEDRVRDHFYDERNGALRFPIDAEGILCCEPGSDVTTVVHALEIADTPPLAPQGGIPLEKILHATILEIRDDKTLVAESEKHGQILLRITSSTRIWKGGWNSGRPIEVGDYFWGYGEPEDEQGVWSIEQMEINIVNLRGPVVGKQETAEGVDIQLEDVYNGQVYCVHIQQDSEVVGDPAVSFGEAGLEIAVGDGLQVVGLKLKDGSVVATSIFP